MVDCFYELHIHSCLSPCADDSMTIHNILNMATLKGLDLIAVTDHNCALNARAIMNVAKRFDLLVVPGIEVETFEGIHLLAYFKTVDTLLEFSNEIYRHLPNIKNNERLLGKQLILNEEDEVVGKVERMLVQSTTIKLNQMVVLIKQYDGIVIPAHINRKRNSIESILGFIPKDLPIDGVEVINKGGGEGVIINSDAHTIANIHEAIYSLRLENKTIDSFFKCFRGEKNA